MNPSSVQPLQLLSTLSQTSGLIAPLMMPASAADSSASLAADTAVVPPAIAVFWLVWLIAVAPSWMTLVFTFQLVPPRVNPASSAAAAFGGSVSASHVSPPSVIRMTFTVRQGRSPPAVPTSGVVLVWS